MAQSLAAFLANVDEVERQPDFLDSVLTWLTGHGIVLVAVMVDLNVADLPHGNLENAGLKKGFVRYARTRPECNSSTAQSDLSLSGVR